MIPRFRGLFVVNFFRNLEMVFVNLKFQLCFSRSRNFVEKASEKAILRFFIAKFLKFEKFCKIFIAQNDSSRDADSIHTYASYVGSF